MDATEERAKEMIRLMKLCPAGGVTDLDVAVAFLARERSAGKVEASEEMSSAFHRTFANLEKPNGTR